MLPWSGYAIMDDFLIGANIEIGTSSSKSKDFDYKAAVAYIV